MKRLLFILAAFLIMPKIFAADTKIGDLYYDLNSSTKTAKVTYEEYERSDNYRNLKGAISIPESVDYEGTKYSVTSIGALAFSRCSGLTSIEIPNSVTEIGERAFLSCSGLKSVVIGNSVTSIRTYAFAGCSKLTSLTIPNSVTSIGDFAFDGCSGLKSVIMGNSVRVYGVNIFRGCYPIKSAYPDNENNPFPSGIAIKYPAQDSEIKDGIIYGKNLSAIYFVPLDIVETFEIPNSVTSIEDYAFYKCSSLKGVNIPNSVTSIGNYSFDGCSGLTGQLTIPNSVTSIGNYSFNGCSGLTGQLTIPNSVTSIGNYSFDGCSGLTSVIIGNSVTSIGQSAFYGCSGLTNAEIGNSVTSIGEYAFWYCSGLTSVTIPNSVTEIGDRAFGECSGLTSAIIGNSVTSIGWYAFRDCSGLTSITIPNSVTSIGADAFWGCQGLQQVMFNCSLYSNGITLYNKFGNRDNLNIFYKDKDDTSMLVDYFTQNNIVWLTEDCTPHCIIKTPYNTDYEISNSIDLGKNLYAVPFNQYITIKYRGTESDMIVIQGGKDITSNVYSEEGYTFLPDFYWQANSVTHYYPNYYTTIEIDTPGTLYSLLDMSAATSLTYLKISGDINGTDIMTLNRITNLKYLDLKDANIVAGGNNYYEYYYSTDDVIGSYFVNNLSKLETIILPTSVTTIQSNAFNGSNLKDIILGEKTEFIYEGAFIGTQVSTISIPASVKLIDNNTFNNCTNLKYVYLEDGEDELYMGFCPNESIRYLFGSCPLKSVYLGREIRYPYPYYPFEETKNKVISSIVLGPYSSIVLGPYNDYDGYLEKLSSDYTRRVVSLFSQPLSTYIPNEITENPYSYLLVPEGTLALYKDTDDWKNFFNIYEINGLTSSGGENSGNGDDDEDIDNGIDDILAEDYMNIENIDIYTLSGYRLYSGASSGAQIPPGIYILVKGCESRKIVIQ